MRAANCQRSPRGQYGVQASTEAVIRNRNLNSMNPTPLTSTGSTTSSTASSSGYGSITNENGHVVDYAKPNVNTSSNITNTNRPITVSVPSVSSGSSSTESSALSPNGSRIIPIIKVIIFFACIAYPFHYCQIEWYAETFLYFCRRNQPQRHKTASQRAKFISIRVEMAAKVPMTTKRKSDDEQLKESSESTGKQFSHYLKSIQFCTKVRHKMQINCNATHQPALLQKQLPFVSEA